MEEEELDRNLLRIGFGRGYEPVQMQTTNWMISQFFVYVETLFQVSCVQLQIQCGHKTTNINFVVFIYVHHMTILDTKPTKCTIL